MAKAWKVVLVGGSVLAFAGVAGLYGLALLRAGAEREIYRDRLRDLTGQYESLAEAYNRAVRQTAVTELVVREGRVSVRVRTADGVVREVETPFDAGREIYVDYAVLSGRVWIRRVFDEATAPADAVVIDPKLADIDWDLAGAEVGKAVYRSLSDGRWVISVSGNGALGLVRLADDAPEVELAGPPAIASFGEVEAQAEQAREGVGLGDLWRRLVGGN